MKVNLLCDKLGIHHKNPMIDTDLNGIQLQQFKNQTSNYTGVHWNRNTKKWQAQLAHNKKRYGGYFDHEEHAAMKVNLLCDKYKIKRKNPMIDIDLNTTIQKIQNKTSIYTGVSWNRDKKKWETSLTYKKTKYYGGDFDNEEHAAMTVNLLCDEYEIKRKNSMIDIDLNTIPQKFKSQTSKYTGVSWNSNIKKWKSQLYHNKKEYHCGYFDNEKHAAMSVNLLCDEYEIKRKNPMIDLKLNAIKQVLQSTKVKNKTSKYIGVSWNKDANKWETSLTHKKTKYCGEYFDNEENAAMSVNLLCDKCKINRKNPEIYDVIQQKTKSKINQSKTKNIVKTEAERILNYECKDKCENNSDMKRQDDDDSVKESYKSQKRKQKENSIMVDEVKKEIRNDYTTENK